MAWTTPGTAVAGDVLTAAFWNTQVRDNSLALYGSIKRLGLQTRGSGGSDNYTISATSVASAADVFSSDISWTADGTSEYVIEFYCPCATSPTNAVGSYISLVKGDGTLIGRLAEIYAAGSGINIPVFVRYRYAPAAGSQTINIRAIKDSSASNGELRFGGTNYAAGYLAIYGADIT